MDSDSNGDDFDSEMGEPIKRDTLGNDIDLIEEGWIVPDDYISDSDNESSVTIREGENEAEYEIRH